MKVGKLFRSIWSRLNAGGLAFNETIADSIDRENVRFILPEDSRLYLTEWVRQRINEKAEWLWQNFACVKDLTEGTARHTIGKGIGIQLETEDQEWNQLAETDFENWALTPDRCDIAGRRNFYEGQLCAIEQYFVRGEFMSGFVENPRWKSPISGNPAAPAFWIIDTNDCRTPLTLDSPYEFGSVVDGIGLGQYGEPQTYHVRTTGQFDFIPVPAGEICHWFKPHAVNQVRGISPFAQAVNPLVDVHELMRMTTRTAKANQLVSMVIKNVGKQKSRGALGAIKNGGPTAPAGSCNQDTAEIEKMGRKSGAAIAYVDTDGDVKMLASAAPSPLVEPFIRDLLMRNACLAPGVPMEFFWDPSKLSGANTRFVLGRADLLFQVLGDGLIYRWCTPTAIRVLAWRIANGLLRPCKDPRWMEKIGWQLPARLTVDNGREGALDLAKIKAGMLTLRAYYNARGMNWRTELLQRVQELKQLKAMCEEAGIPEMFQYFVALDPGAGLIQSKSDEQDKKDPDAPEEDDKTDEEDRDDPAKKKAA